MGQFRRKVAATMFSLVSAGVAATVVAPLTAWASTVTVQPGQSLYKIAAQNHITLQSLESANPNVSARNLQVGSVLTIPSSATSYTVKSGDTMWKIAHEYGVTLGALQGANPHVSAADLMVGTRLTIPAGGSARSSTASAVNTSSASRSYSNAIYWLSRIISAESANQTVDAQISVGDVVWHRVQSSKYPNTVKSVVFQISNGHYQFSPVLNGTIYHTPSPTSIQAAHDVLDKHMDLVPGAYVFYTRSKIPSTSWVLKQPVMKTYDQITFAV